MQVFWFRVLLSHLLGARSNDSPPCAFFPCEIPVNDRQPRRRTPVLLPPLPFTLALLFHPVFSKNYAHAAFSRTRVLRRHQDVSGGTILNRMVSCQILKTSPVPYSPTKLWGLSKGFPEILYSGRTDPPSKFPHFRRPQSTFL